MLNKNILKLLYLFCPIISLLFYLPFQSITNYPIDMWISKIESRENWWTKGGSWAMENLEENGWTKYHERC
jgi:hypothetical protein